MLRIKKRFSTIVSYFFTPLGTVGGLAYIEYEHGCSYAKKQNFYLEIMTISFISMDQIQLFFSLFGKVVKLKLVSSLFLQINGPFCILKC